MRVFSKLFFLIEGLCIIFLFGSVCGRGDVSLKPINIFYFEPSLSEVAEPTHSVNKKANMTCRELGVDESCIVIESNVDFKVKFLYESMECDKCLLQELKSIPPHSSEKVILKFASLGSVWEIVDEENKSICSQEKQYLGENSWYHIYVNETGCYKVCDKEPEFAYYPLLIAAGVYLLLGLIWNLFDYIRRKEIISHIFKRNSLDVSTDLAAAFSSSNSSSESFKKKPATKRLKSLDTVRGIAIVIMIFVNYGGGKYWFFHHAHWNGLTVADLVFPWFMWMMGMSMALSLRSLLRKAIPRKKIFKKIVVRSMKLFALGLMLNTYCTVVDLQKLRIPGVLQRFGITYFIVATVHLFYASAEDNQASSSSAFGDIIPYGGEWLIMCTFLALHILLMFFVHSPNCPAGYFGPGGTHDGGKYSMCTGGAAGYVDRMVLGSNHLYQRPSPKAIYHTTLPFDPEGILGFLTSIFLVFLGLQAGKILLTYKDAKARLTRWIAWSCFTGVFAAILCLGSKNDGFIPVNKNLWSVSFILATGSLAFALISICYYIIDVKNWWTGAPFYYAGMNAILLYVGHEITDKMFPWTWQIEPTHMNELFQDLWGTTLWVLIAIWMYRRNFFLIV